MDGLGRAIGAPVPIEFDGQTVLLDGMGMEDIGIVEQYLLSQLPKPMALARPESIAFIQEAAKLVPKIAVLETDIQSLKSSERMTSEESSRLLRLMSELHTNIFLRDELIGMAEKIMADARRDAGRKSSIPAKDVGEWLDSIEGMAFSVWLKLDQRYPGRFDKKHTLEIIQNMRQDAQEKLKLLRDQAAGFDDLGNSTGPVSKATAEIGPTGD